MIEPFTFGGLPTRVIFGVGTISHAAEEIERLGAKRAVVLTTPQQKRDGEELGVRLGLGFAGAFNEATMHTPEDVTERALSVVHELRADCVVSFGGGSTTGLGKAIALRTGLNQLCIPTTYAGSEMTAILGETRHGIKTTVKDRAVLPETVIYDVNLTTTLPAGLTATSGINAMAHAVEALYARDRNPVISLMAAEGIRVLVNALPIIADGLDDLNARTDALYGAWLCGTCLGAVGMGLHHKICHALGGAFNLPHAETHAIVLPHVIAYNAPAIPDAIAHLAEAMGAVDPAQRLFDLAQRLGISVALKEVGMPESGIGSAADLVMQSTYWNPAPVERDAVRDLLVRAWSGDRPQ